MLSIPPSSQSSKRAVNTAGELLRDWYGALLRGETSIDEISSEIRTAFAVVSECRKSFASPLKNVTVGVRQFG